MPYTSRNFKHPSVVNTISLKVSFAVQNTRLALGEDACRPNDTKLKYYAKSKIRKRTKATGHITNEEKQSSWPRRQANQYF